VEVLNNILALAQRERVNFRGEVTWAFEFEDQPPFAGFRELATNGIDKPVLNAFRMLGMLGGERVKVVSSRGLSFDDVVHSGVRAEPDINVIATRKVDDREMEILVWNYHDDDVPFPAAPVSVKITGIPASATRCLLEHFRVDGDHSNAFTAWKAIGSPLTLSAAHVEQLQSAGQLQLLTSPAWITIQNRSVELQFDLPRQGLSLLRLTW
jgi:xylan 1,4-beta-xylosidase